MRTGGRKEHEIIREGAGGLDAARAGSPERFETPRILATRLEPGDLRDLARLLGDPRVAKTLSPTGRPISDSEVLLSLDEKLRHWEDFGFGLWLLRDRSSGAFLGRGGLQHTWATGEAEVEVGWAIVPERWGQGLATELAHAALQAAFGRLALPDVIAYTRPDNRASRRVMEKAGLVFERALIVENLEHVLYRLLAPAGPELA